MERNAPKLERQAWILGGSKHSPNQNPALLSQLPCLLARGMSSPRQPLYYSNGLEEYDSSQPH
jgi:hypothetical protein